MAYVCPICGKKHITTGCPTHTTYAVRMGDHAVDVTKMIKEAERAAYIQALDDVKESILSNGFFSKEDVVAVIDQLKSDYQKGKTE